jgi:hypothetical protein
MAVPGEKPMAIDTRSLLLLSKSGDDADRCTFRRQRLRRWRRRSSPGSYGPRTAAFQCSTSVRLRIDVVPSMSGRLDRSASDCRIDAAI